MTYPFSKIGRLIASGSGIGDLMDDLGHALANAGPNMKMLGGGQPAQIPEINEIWRQRLAEISADKESAIRLLSIYDPPQGNPAFVAAVAKLLVEASERTQLVVTTHSRMLIDALGDDPESVIVCEKHDGESTFERLDGERMKVWLEDYSLGDLWSKGEIGGNRW